MLEMLYTLNLKLENNGSMINLARQIDLKLKKFDELMIKLKTKHLDKPDIYADLHKLNERIDEIQKLVDNNK